jgi:Glycosyl hydrolase-like 10
MATSSRRLFLQMAAAAGARIAGAQDTGSQDGSIYLADMTRCRPQSALSRKPRRHHWRLLDYETDSFKGTMLVAGQNTAAAEVSCPLAQKGWHAIYFGLRSYGGEDQTRLQVRLKSDSTFSLMVHHPGARNRLDEYFWRCADLTGEEIVLRQLKVRTVPESADSPANGSSGAWVAYIRLVPVAESDLKTLPETRRLFAHNDAWSYTFTYRPTAEPEIRRELEPFRDTDFSRIYWEAGMGDRMYYPTRLGLTAADDWIEDPYRAGDRLAAETWRSWRKQRIDPFRVALEYAHKLGLQFHATYRVAGFHFPAPEDEWNSGGAYDKHPEWRGRDRAGHSTPRLSYAYPEVRRMSVGFLKEMAQYPIDGICLAYNRRPPLVEYEAPVIDGFRARFGEDPGRIGDRDARWLSYRATFLTEFMREVRASMGKLEVSAIVMSSEAENLYYGMDLKAWIGEGLVDTIIPYTSVPGLSSTADSWLEPRDAQFFLDITRGSRTKLALNLMPRQLSPDEYRRRAHALYRAGAEHLFFWDTNQRNDFSPSWSVLRRLGHREELEDWARAGSQAFVTPGRSLRKLGDWDLSYATPG